MQQFSILVNTTDTFEDCWVPFFKLFQRFWPDYKGKVFLNTEYKHFEYDGLDIICVRNSEGINKKLTWSECLIKALNKIDSDNILYMQEDYFLNNYVKTELLSELYDKFLKLSCDCLHLTDQSTAGPFRQTSDNMIWEIEKNAPYRISCQAAFWKKEVLLSYLRKHESAWQFEHYGTKRSRWKNDNFCVINSDLFSCGKKEIVPYIFTGIIKGKWNRKTADIFERYSIRIDYERRGFCDADIQKTLLEKIKNRLNNKYIKTTLLSNSEIFLLKLKKKFGWIV